MEITTMFQYSEFIENNKKKLLLISTSCKNHTTKFTIISSALEVLEKQENVEVNIKDWDEEEFESIIENL